MKTRLKRGTIGAAVVLMIFGAGAFAQEDPVDTESAPVTVAALSGERGLTLTGADTAGLVGAGPVSLAFNENSLSSPFGVVVTDATYSRVGYQVDATLSNLYRVTPGAGTNGFDCTGTRIDSSQFSVDFLNFDSLVAQLQRDVEGVLEPTVTFLASETDLEALLGITLDGDETVSVVGNTITRTLNDLSFMTVTDGANDPNTFDVADAHPTCGEGGAATPLVLQNGTKNEPSLDAVVTDLSAGVVSVGDAIAAGLLPTGADSGPDGSVWVATQNLLETLMDPLLVTDPLVDSVVAGLTLDDIALDILGQSGAYANVPRLNLTEGATEVTTGLYHGVLTVTLTDTE